MVCGPAPLPQTSLYSVYPPLDQEAYWAEEDQHGGHRRVGPEDQHHQAGQDGQG